MESIALSRLEKRILNFGILGKVALTLMFVLITALSSKVKVFLPFSPVPITLQTFSVILSGIVLKEFGAFSQVIYLVLGILGLGLFANGGGVNYVLSPTFGYVVGFVFASYIAGYFTKRYSNSRMLILGLIIANLAIYVPGLLWLYVVLSKGGNAVSLQYILSIGFLPFVIGDILKIFASLGFAKAIKRI